MRSYVIIAIALAVICMAEAAGRKKIISSKRIIDSNSAQNTTIDELKASDKSSYPKKATSLKKRPTKSPNTPAPNATGNALDIAKPAKDVTEVFKNLPADDFEFIKELDKQFKLHGDKLKIKVEHDNSTEPTKNSKRTIDGDLGYGYAHNGYTYERPKFMFYPYSQKDIPAAAPGYYPQYESTSVTIEPSYSYELKPQTYIVQHEPSSPQIDLPQSSGVGPITHHENGYQEPVIVLRIPGPMKYASHLQTLLQQYLEIRAAQYLKILQETESRKQQGYNQQHAPDLHNEEQHYEQPPPPASHPVEAPIQNYPADVDYSHHGAPTPQPISYPAIDDVYQAYRERPHYQQQAGIEQQQQHVQENSAGQTYTHLTDMDEPQQYYYPNEQHNIQTHPHTAYEQVYVIAMGPAAYSDPQVHYQQQNYGTPQQPIYVEEDDTQYANQAYSHEQSGNLATSENNPRSTHTKIIFTPKSKNANSDLSNMYPLPSIRPFERHEPASTAYYRQHYQQEGQGELDYQQMLVESVPHQDTVSITQRPFNYHAHASKTRSHPGRKRATSGSVSTTTKAPATKTPPSQSVDQTEQHLQKIRKYVHEKLGAQTGSAVEIKTSQIVKG